MNCKFCKRHFKNKHGLHIHLFYCLVKKFSEMPIKYVNSKKKLELMDDEKFMPSYNLPIFYSDFLKTNEIGIMLGVRLILKI